MAGKPPKDDPVQDAPQVAGPKHAAAGLPAIGHTLRIAQQQMGVKRTALTLLRVNQKDGFDCPGCAWPEPDHRHAAEFCENGAKAVAEEATLRRVTPEFFAAHTVADLADAQRLLARPAGPAHAPHVPPRGRRPLRAGDLGARLRHRRRGARPPSAPPTRPSSTPPAAPATRPRSSTSCSRASSAPTTCRTARTCATSRPARRCPRRSASARAASCWRTSTRPT